MEAQARFGELVAREPAQVRHDAAALDEPGFWAVVRTFEGALTAVRFDRVDRVERRRSEPADLPALVPLAEAAADPSGSWQTSLDEAAYVAAVRQVRERIAAGTVYQVNVCRVLQRPLPAGVDLDRLAGLVAAGNPAPYAARLHVPAAGWDVVCASPELHLARDGDRLWSAPMKGTAPTAEQLLAKDVTENVMITDLVRNDLSPVAVPGTVAVEGLCTVEQHPGLVQLVSTVSCRLRPGTGWPAILASAAPAGSVSGAPKSTALQAIRDLEPQPRGPYCGSIGYVDNRDPRRPRARLAVGIRTFWAHGSGPGRALRFGAGAGITWDSDPLGEWRETQLKAHRLVALAQAALAPDDGRPGPAA